MALREDMERQGLWLFRWRSYLPLLGIPLLFVALRQVRVLEALVGNRASELWGVFAVLVSFAGLLVRGFTVGFVPRGTSGRNTKSQVAETLNTTGMYSVVRNPLYLGNFVIVLGIALFLQSWWLLLMMLFGCWLYYERIIFSEEEFLRKKFGQHFIDWAQATPIFLPRWRNWKKPALPFSFKTVLRREFSTFFSIVSSFFFLEVGNNLLTKHRFLGHGAWAVFFVTGLIIYWVFFILKKRTRALNVEGR
jgi:protein-S-isoprenylcysteine O-methyltransferase Ste14